MTERSRKNIRIMAGIMTAALLLVMFVTHRTVPFMMDDLWYSTMLSDDAPIASFTDIVKSQIWHYNHWGGRSMTHGILQLTLLAGELGADVLNMLFTLLLGLMICQVAQNRTLPGFFAAIAMTLGLNANWRMSMFWQAGAANYLYITVFLLAFVHCYLRELPDEGSLLPGSGMRRRRRGGLGMGEETDSIGRGALEGIGSDPGNCPANRLTEGQAAVGEKGVPKPLPGISLWIVPLGVLAGWSNENMGPAVWMLSLAVILLGWREGRRTRPWMVLGNLACLAGSAMCILAPGNFVRSSQIEEEQYGTLWKLFLRSYGECKGLLEYLFPVLLVLGCLLIVSCCVLGQPLGRRNGLMLCCALLSWGAFILSPHYPDRASFGTMALCVCVSLSLAGRILRSRQDLAWPLWGGAVLIGLRGMYFCGEYLALSWGWIR